MSFLVPYAQLILEYAELNNVEEDLVDQIFDFMVRDFTRYATQLYSKAGATKEQAELSQKIMDRLLKMKSALCGF